LKIYFQKPKHEKRPVFAPAKKAFAISRWSRRDHEIIPPKNLLSKTEA